jgi:hypothetical protein
MRAPNDVVLAELTADRNDMVHEEVRVQNNLDGRNKEDILLPRAETETVSFYGTCIHSWIRNCYMHALDLLVSLPFVSFWSLKGAYEKESSDPSDDKEWSGTSASQKELEDTETDLLAASNRAECLAKRTPVEPQNNKHTPLTEWLQGSVNEKLSEAPFSNGSSSKARKYRFDPIVNQVCLFTCSFVSWYLNYHFMLIHQTMELYQCILVQAGRMPYLPP